MSLTFAWFIKLSHSFFFFLSLFVFVACLCGSPSVINFQLIFQALNFIHVIFWTRKAPYTSLTILIHRSPYISKIYDLGDYMGAVRWTSVGRDSSVDIATRCGLDGPGIEYRWGEIYRPRPGRPYGLPSLLHNGYRVFPGGKAVGAWRWPPIPSSAEVKEGVELHFHSPSGPSWPVLGWTLPYMDLNYKESNQYKHKNKY